MSIAFQFHFISFWQKKNYSKFEAKFAYFCKPLFSSSFLTVTNKSVGAKTWHVLLLLHDFHDSWPKMVDSCHPMCVCDVFITGHQQSTIGSTIRKKTKNHKIADNKRANIHGIQYVGRCYSNYDLSNSSKGRKNELRFFTNCATIEKIVGAGNGNSKWRFAARNHEHFSAFEFHSKRIRDFFTNAG